MRRIHILFLQRGHNHSVFHRILSVNSPLPLLFLLFPRNSVKHLLPLRTPDVLLERDLLYHRQLRVGHSDHRPQCAYHLPVHPSAQDVRPGYGPGGVLLLRLPDDHSGSSLQAVALLPPYVFTLLAQKHKNIFNQTAELENEPKIQVDVVHICAFNVLLHFRPRVRNFSMLKGARFSSISS